MKPPTALRALREARRLTQAELGRRAGVTGERICALERGDYPDQWEGRPGKLYPADTVSLVETILDPMEHYVVQAARATLKAMPKPRALPRGTA
jgi:transcriptional regulator with XRE-family HTH domain